MILAHSLRAWQSLQASSIELYAVLSFKQPTDGEHAWPPNAHSGRDLPQIGLSGAGGGRGGGNGRGRGGGLGNVGRRGPPDPPNSGSEDGKSGVSSPIENSKEIISPPESGRELQKSYDPSTS